MTPEAKRRTRGPADETGELPDCGHVRSLSGGEAVIAEDQRLNVPLQTGMTLQGARRICGGLLSGAPGFCHGARCAVK